MRFRKESRAHFPLAQRQFPNQEGSRMWATIRQRTTYSCNTEAFRGRHLSRTISQRLSEPREHFRVPPLSGQLSRGTRRWRCMTLPPHLGRKPKVKGLNREPTCLWKTPVAKNLIPLFSVWLSYSRRVRFCLR